MRVIPANPATPHHIHHLDRPVTLKEIQNAVGGAAEEIPNFDTILQEDQIQPCIAFSNLSEKFPDRALNQRANTLWLQALTRRYGQDRVEPEDALVGMVVLLTGDAAFMQAI